MKKNKLSKRNKNQKVIKRIKKFINEYQKFCLVLVVLALVFGWLVFLNQPVTGLNSKGLRFLNKYEYPTYLIEAGRCMRPYDVGDGVVTFGPGITYSTTELGVADINQKLGTNYSLDDNCIKTKDLIKMQKLVLQKYENVVLNIEQQYQVEFNQDQFNALVLLAYNSPNLFKDQTFIAVITNPTSSYEQYVLAADSYYQQLSGYYTDFGTGWYNRIKDSAEMYYFGDYKFQNNLEV